MRIELPTPHANQEKILNADKRFIVVMCGRRFGKSELSQILIIKEALKGGQVAYITPTYGLAQVFFERLAKVLPFKSNISKLKIYCPNEGSIEFFTGERLDNLRGRKFHLVIVDEAAFIADLEDGWNNSIRPTLTDYEGKAVFLSTPRGKNFFYSLFMKQGENDWQSFKFSTYDNPHINPREIDEARIQLPEVVFEQEYMANPSENSANPFGNAFIKRCVKPISAQPIVCYGIDLAKSVDYTVIIGLDKDGNVAYFDRFQMDWHNTKETIKRLPPAPIVVDSTGVGDPILEDLLREGVNIEGLKFTSQSKQQLMEGLASAIQQGRIEFPEGVIVDELDVFEYQFTAHGVRYSAPSGFHDDTVMALALAWQNHNIKRGSGRYAFA
jgi:Terminase large subunit, T4likevirus-type, N-terminal/Terminase RNaseH-like domain